MNPSPTERPPDRLVNHLLSLAAQREEEVASARAALARLRASLSEGRAIEALHLVLPHLDVGREMRTQREDDAILLAGLFALHPEHGPQSLAAALRKVATLPTMKFDDNGSGAQRFRALLSASREDLAPHLRTAVALVASKNEAIDWYDLHRVIRCWGDDRYHAAHRRAWSRDFWTAPSAPETTTSTEDTRKE